MNKMRILFAVLFFFGLFFLDWYVPVGILLLAMAYTPHLEQIFFGFFLDIVWSVEEPWYFRFKFFVIFSLLGLNLCKI